VNRCCPQGIVELNRSLGRSGGGMSGFDFDPSSAIVAGVEFNCGHQPRCQTAAIMCRFARASISGSVTAERSAFSVAMTRRKMLG
jgi:hypothetical protein